MMLKMDRDVEPLRLIPLREGDTGGVQKKVSDVNENIEISAL